MVRKIKSKTDNSGWVDPAKKRKVRKKRKPMSAEQKQAAAERLEKARQARAAKNPTMVNLVFMKVCVIYLMMLPLILRRLNNGLRRKKNLPLWSVEMKRQE